MKITSLKGFFKVRIRGTFIYCPFCHCIQVLHGTPIVEETETERIESYKVCCSRCGKTGTIMEKWTKEEGVS